MIARDTPLQCAAFHEAGHAVLAHYLNVGLERVTVVPDEDSQGATIEGDELCEASEALRLVAEEAYWMRKAIVRYGGAEAVRRLSPNSKWRRGAGEDYLRASIALENITDDSESLRALSNYAKRRARLLVENYWPEIGRVARRLLEAKSLDGNEVASVLAGSIGERRGRVMGY